MRNKKHPEISAFGTLLLFAVVWMPIYLLMTCILISAICVFLAGPIYGVVMLYVGIFPAALLAFASACVGYLVSRLFVRKMWEPPESFL